MKIQSKIALYTAMSLAIAANIVSPSAAEPSKEVAALHAADATFVHAYNSRDFDTAVGLYADDAILLAPGVPSAAGEAAIRAYYVAIAKEGVKFTLNPGPKAEQSGDLGWSSGTYFATGKDGQVVDKGKYLSVSRKVAGKWLYVRDTWNSDSAPAK
jgi:ketosteroid isomerase-like protein